MEKSENLNPNDFVEDDEAKTGGSDKPGDGDDSTAKDPNSQKSQEELEKEKEEKAKNARSAEIRRKKEAEEKAERERRERAIREQATLEAKLDMIKVNPFTEEPIVDEEDLRVYEIQKDLETEGKDPIQDLPKRMAQLRRQETATAKKAKEEEEAKKKASDDKVAAEISELREKYPKVNTSELAKDPLFLECLNGRAGRWTQVEIYEYYLEKKAIADKKAEEERQKNLIDENGKRISQPPSSKGPGNNTPHTKVSDMTRDEFMDYWKKKYGE